MEVESVIIVGGFLASCPRGQYFVLFIRKLGF